MESCCRLTIVVVFAQVKNGLPLSNFVLSMWRNDSSLEPNQLGLHLSAPVDRKSSHEYDDDDDYGRKFGLEWGAFDCLYTTHLSPGKGEGRGRGTRLPRQLGQMLANKLCLRGSLQRPTCCASKSGLSKVEMLRERERAGFPFVNKQRSLVFVLFVAFILD